MKRMSILIALFFVACALPSVARIEEINNSCDPPPVNGVAREVNIYQDGADHPFYSYWILCDGSVEEWYDGWTRDDYEKVTALPPAPLPYTFRLEESSTGAIVDRIFQGSTEIGKIEHSGVPGTGIVVTIY